MNNDQVTSEKLTKLRQELEQLKQEKAELKTLLVSKEQQIERLKTLQEKELLLQLVLDNIPQLIFWKDCNSVFQGCNRLWAKAAGFSQPNEVIGKTDYDLYPNASNLEEYLEKDRQVIDSGQPQYHLEYKPNKDVWYDTRKIPIRDSQGNIVGILATIEDITQRKKAEEALRLAEQKYRSIFENALEGIFQSTPDGKFISLNPALAHIYGYESPEDLMANISETSTQIYIDPTSQKEFKRLLDETGEAKGLQYQVRQQQGKLIWVEEHTRAVQDDNRQVLYYEGIVQDITKRKQAEQVLTNYHRTLEAKITQRTQALEKAKKAADAANQAKSTFIANMSHELRTPLNAIIGFAQVLGRDTTLTPAQKQQIDIINSSGEHLLSLINSILEMSKIEAGRTTLKETSFDLEHFLKEIQDLFRLRAQSKGLELIFNLAPDLPQYVSTDESKLRQILINLLGNAIKFTDKGRVTLGVGVGGGVLGAKKETVYTLLFEVEDTGAGIAIDELDKLFIAFEQTHTGRHAQQGTGLGLAISRKFVQLMGGNISVSSTVGVGSCFRFEIQISRSSAEAVLRPQPERKAIGLALNQPQYRILVVDDRFESRLLLMELLSSVGFQVREAANGQEAVAVWEAWEPHLIWMDMRMPVMDGWEATRQIRARQKSATQVIHSLHPAPYTPYPTIIIALTASAFEEERTVTMTAGCDDFVGKPFREAVVWDKMAQYLGVQYLYEDTQTSTAITDDQVEPSSLQIMPTEWITQLYQMAKQLNRKEIVKLIEQIPETDTPLAEQLRQLAQSYRFEKIVELAKQDFSQKNSEKSQ